MSDKVQVQIAVKQIEQEALDAITQFPAFNSGHEGWAVIKEELDELWDEVRAYPNADPNKMAKEAIQIGAMAARFVADLCPIEHLGAGGE